MSSSSGAGLISPSADLCAIRMPACSPAASGSALISLRIHHLNSFDRESFDSDSSNCRLREATQSDVDCLGTLVVGVRTSQLNQAKVFRVTDLDDVAGAERCRTVDPLAVEEGAVSAPQVSKGAARAVERDFGVTPADKRVGDDNIIIIGTTNARSTMSQRI